MKIIVITGPTGVGKTKLSIELAKEYDGEIINGDAIQIYKGLDIGSAKVREDEKEGIEHHLFDIKEVWEDYSIYDYQKDCRKVIKEIQDKGKTPIIVGGTGLYIKSALYNYTLEESSSNLDIDYEEVDTDNLYKRLKELDKNIEIDKNIFNKDLEKLRKYLLEIDELRISGIFFYDLSLINLKTKLNLKTDLIYSPNFLVTNYKTCNYYEEMGIKGILISPCITKDEIKEIIEKTNINKFINTYVYENITSQQPVSYL